MRYDGTMHIHDGLHPIRDTSVCAKKNPSPTFRTERPSKLPNRAAFNPPLLFRCGRPVNLLLRLLFLADWNGVAVFRCNPAASSCGESRDFDLSSSSPSFAILFTSST